MYAGQRWIHKLCNGNIIESDHPDILGYLYTITVPSARILSPVSSFRTAVVSRQALYPPPAWLAGTGQYPGPSIAGKLGHYHGHQIGAIVGQTAGHRIQEEN